MILIIHFLPDFYLLVLALLLIMLLLLPHGILSFTFSKFIFNTTCKEDYAKTKDQLYKIRQDFFGKFISKEQK